MRRIAGKGEGAKTRRGELSRTGGTHENINGDVQDDHEIVDCKSDTILRKGNAPLHVSSDDHLLRSLSAMKSLQSVPQVQLKFYH